jgi:hypothetical protein
VKPGNHAATFIAPDATTWRRAMTSPQNEKPLTGSFGELSEAECREFLEQHTAGRVVFMAGDGPQILPVTYQYRNGSVIFSRWSSGRSRPSHECRFRDRQHR